MLFECQTVPGELVKDLDRSIGTKCEQPGARILRNDGWRLAESQEISRDRTTPDVMSTAHAGQIENQTCIGAAGERCRSRRAPVDEQSCGMIGEVHQRLRGKVRRRRLEARDKA